MNLQKKCNFFLRFLSTKYKIYWSSLKNLFKITTSYRTVTMHWKFFFKRNPIFSLLHFASLLFSDIFYVKVLGESFFLSVYLNIRKKLTKVRRCALSVQFCLHKNGLRFIAREICAQWPAQNRASRLIHLSQLADVVQMIFLKLKIRRAMNILRTSFCVWRRKMKTRSPIVIFGNQFCWLFIHQLILFLFSAVYNLDEQKGEENFCDRKFNQNYKNETKSAFEKKWNNPDFQIATERKRITLARE